MALEILPVVVDAELAELLGEDAQAELLDPRLATPRRAPAVIAPVKPVKAKAAAPAAKPEAKATPAPAAKAPTPKAWKGSPR